MCMYIHYMYVCMYIYIYIYISQTPRRHVAQADILHVRVLQSFRQPTFQQSDM